MARTKQQTRRTEAREPAQRNERPAGPDLPPGRRWGFRLGAALLLPLLALCLAELGLRLAGFGYPTSFFLPAKINHRGVFVENDKFGWRFFPPQLARSPAPVVMPAEKAKDTYRIFILGESAALGDPEPAFGFGRWLRVLLEERFPGQHFEVVCTAMTAIDSHAILPIARECARHQGDLWIVYMGNNEFVGPFGPCSVFGRRVPPLGLVRLNLALKKTRVGQLVAWLGSNSSNQKAWGGMKMFTDQQLAPDDPQKVKVYDYFQANLEAMLAVAERAGVKVVLSTVASNLKDCPPFGSLHSGNLSGQPMADWQQEYGAAVREQTEGNLPAALTNFEAAARLDGSFAELQFRWAQCLLALTNSAQAKLHFDLARDDDSLPFRADTRLNGIVAQTASAQAGRGVAFLDSVSALANDGTPGMAGRECFYEHVHLNFQGNYRLALAAARIVATLLPASRAPATSAWLSFDQCARRLALTPWDEHRVYEGLAQRLAEPPFIAQPGHAAQIEWLQETLAQLRAEQTPRALEHARLLYRQATQAAPEDFYLLAGFAKLEEDSADFTEAVRRWGAVRDLLPFAPGPHYYLGRVLARNHQEREALQEFSRALAIQPDLPGALEEMARLLTKMKQFDEALALLRRAGELEPANARLCLEKAEALAQAGRRTEAFSQLLRAVELQPNNAEARYLLGVELAFQGDLRPAAEQFLETIRLSPKYAPGHLNLGIALAKLGKVDQAIDQFQATLRLEPGNQRAAEYLEKLEAGRKR